MNSFGDWDPRIDAFKNKQFNPDKGGRKEKNILYIIGIPPEITSRALENLFSSYGKVEKANVLAQKQPGLPRAGFVHFSSPSEAEIALRKLNGTRIGKFVLKIEYARPKPVVKENDDYISLIQKLEKAPLIASDLKMLVQKVDEQLANRTLYDDEATFQMQKSLQNNSPKKIIPSSCQESNCYADQGDDKQLSNNHLTACEICSKLTSKVCSSCSSVYYCSVECQKKDWTVHKKLCKAAIETLPKSHKSTVSNINLDDDEPLIVVDDAILKGFEEKLKATVHKVPQEQTKHLKSGGQNTAIVRDTVDVLSSVPHPISNIKVDQVIDLVVCDLDKSDGAFLCKSVQPDTLSALEKLQEKLNKYYGENPVGQLEDFRVGALCCAVFADDNLWYRGIIEKVSTQSGKAFVRFMDYGNTQVVMKDQLKSLVEKFKELPTFCLKCKLFASSCPWSEDALAFLADVMKRNGVHIKFTVKEIVNRITYVGEIISDGVNFNSEYIKRGFVKLPPANDKDVEKIANCSLGSESEKEDQVELKSAKVQVESKSIPAEVVATELVGKKLTSNKLNIKSIELPKENFQLLISHVNTPTDFYCQIVQEGLVKLNEYLKDMTSFFSAHSTSSDWKPDIGEVCAAQFSEDKLWYRATVIEVSENVKVCFLDYGNNEDVSMANIRPLPEQFEALPIQAFHASLINLYPLDGKNWSPEAVALMKKCQNHPLTALIEQNLRPAPLVIFIDEKFTLNDHFVQAGLATSMPPKIEAIKQIPEVPSVDTLESVLPPQWHTKVSINLTEASTMGQLYCQLISNDLVALDEAAAKLTKHCNAATSIPTSLLSSPKVGKICAAFFEKDKCWYRAKIIKIIGNEANVFYVDYGNSSTVSFNMLQKLPEEFAQPSAQSLKVILADCTFPEQRWSAEMIKLIQKCMNCPLDAKFMEGDGQTGYVVKIPDLLNLLICNKHVKYSF